MPRPLAGIDKFPRIRLGHVPTPLDAVPNLGAALGIGLWVKRDDCTGLAFGGNKVRQLEFYLGEARARGADTVLITGAVQSNFVRRAASRQRPRVANRAAELAAMMDRADVVLDDGDVDVSDEVHAPGYGKLNDAIREAISMAARLEALLLDPVYTGKAMAGLIAHVRSGRIRAGSRVLFLHTGGLPAIFAYGARLDPRP